MMAKRQLASRAAAAVLLAVSIPSLAAAPAPKKPSAKIVFLWSKGHHPNEPSCRLFKHCLEHSPNVKGIRAEVHEQWPADEAALNGAGAIVIYSEGTNKKGLPHPVLTAERMKRLGKLMDKGTGLVLLHYALYATREVEAPNVLRWAGAYYDFQGYGSKHFVSRKPLVCTPASANHPISRGWKAFTLKANEIYHNLRFTERPTTPILTARMPGPKGKPPARHVIAWALERPDGGRGFGFGGGHFYDMWLNDDCRKMVLNAIAWAAGIDVPAGGVQSRVPDELKAPAKAKAH